MDATLGNLVISRRPGQRVLIAGDIEVAVVKVHGEKVTIAIRAPKGVPIIRDELANQLPAATAESAA